ncbi:MAG: hypothetical protein JWN43_2686 [Gammaproteobacteria bacterium]|nr:hypothetical protein [Gammaproteobacteria bacterium]
MTGLTFEQTATPAPAYRFCASRIASVSRGLANRLGVRETKKTEKNEIVSAVGGMRT